jgi:hypothetical protein
MSQHGVENKINTEGQQVSLPTLKDQNNVDHLFDKRCDALRICAWWKNSEFYVKVLKTLLKKISRLKLHF